ncbi:MAG: DUF885 domain-containing protein [Gammaproteobacteria bacterium]|nr:DUF885 domain-containing protein [Gammaproteobacteria bacterium]
MTVFKNLIRLSGLLLAGLVISACSEAPETGASSEPVAPPVAEAGSSEKAQQLDALYEEYFELSLQRYPLFATSIGDYRYNDRFTVSIAPDFRAETARINREYLQRALAFGDEGLTGQDLLSFRMFVRELERDIAGEQYPEHLLPMNQFYSTLNSFVQLGSGGGVHPFDSVKDYEDFLSRVDGFEQWVDQAIANMQEGIEKDVVLPKVLVQRAIPQLEAQLVDDIEESLFWKPVTSFPEDFSPEDQERLTVAYRDTIEGRIIPAYRKMRDFLVETYEPAARETAGMWDLPNGDAWYAFKVEGTTTTQLTPAQIHQIGLDEVARIHEEMRGVMEDVGFEGTLEEFFVFMNDSPQFIADSREDLLDRYEQRREIVAANVGKEFDIAPKAPFEIRPVERFREKSASNASYRTGTPDGSRPGIFYVNTYDISARPIWTVESLYLHEAIPGHHFQLSLQQELEGLPRFRSFGGQTAFIEGWGLYTENLGKPLGLYTDPYQYFGKLNAELWRSIRLVVDTGLHFKQWSREDVLEYMYANSAVKEARAVSEAERYMAIPSQALAYKIGQLKISELRARAEAALGDHFDPRDFHRQVLTDGSLPLSILEEKIDRWIASVQYPAD